MELIPLLFFIALYTLIETIIVVPFVFLRSPGLIRVVGFGGTALLFLVGLGVTLFLHWLNRALGAQPDATFIMYGLTVSLLVAAPLLVATLIRAKQRKQWSPGQCSDCGYDLRGNPESTKCPECGASVFRLHDADSPNNA